MKNIFTILCLLCCIHLSYGQQAPDFTITTSTGEEISLYETYLDNNKTVVLELFFDSCPSCNSFAPLLGDLYKAWGNGTEDVEFIALDVRSTETDQHVNAFQSRHGHTWPGASAEGGSLEAIEPYRSNEFGMYLGTPTIIIIAPDKTVAFNVNGFSRDAQGIALLDAAIAATGATKPVSIASITGSIQNSLQQGIGSVGLTFTGGTEAIIITDETGQFTLPDLPIDQAYTITPEKNTNFSNGVTTFDLVLIRKHILGIELFDTEAKRIAADANLSNTISTFDLVLLRQGILGVDTDLPAGSWRFIPAQIELSSLNDLTDLSFLGIKIGDINNSADPANLHFSEPRSSNTPFSFLVDNQYIQAGDIVEVPFKIAATDLMGFQLTLDFDASVLQFLKIEKNTLPSFGEGNINTRKSKNGQVTMSWFDVQSSAKKELFTLQFKAKQSGQLKDLLTINSSITPAEAYRESGEIVGLVLEMEAIKNHSTKFQIVPNPTRTGLARLSFFTNQVASANIQVWSADGRLMQQLSYPIKEKGAQQVALSTMELDAGIYFVKIWSGQRLLESGKIVVE